MRTVVIGLGSGLASDDAVGVEVARVLSTRELPAGVQVVEGALAGLGLINLLLDADRAILIDAIAVGLPPGTILRLAERDLPRAKVHPISAHDLAAPEALDLGQLLYPERMPRETLFIGIEVGTLDLLREGLSPSVQAAIPGAVEAVMAELMRGP